MDLKSLSDNVGATKNRMRVGRGIGSGKGKTCGRGVKGQTSRTGVSINGFEGGQMPLHMRMPKRGFRSLSRQEYAVLNLSVLEEAIKSKRLKAGAKITEAMLYETGVVTGRVLPVKLLAKGTLSSKVDLEVSRASAAALEAVSKAGGTVTVLEAVPASAE